MPNYHRGSIDEVTSSHPVEINFPNFPNSPTTTNNTFLQLNHPNADFNLVSAETLYRGISINTDMKNMMMNSFVDLVDNASMVENKDGDQTDLSKYGMSSSKNSSIFPREKGQLLSKRQRTANMSEQYANMYENSDFSDDENNIDSEYETDTSRSVKLMSKRDPRKRERKNSVSVYGQLRRSHRDRHEHKHDHSHCQMYSSTSGIDSQSTNNSDSNPNIHELNFKSIDASVKVKIKNNNNNNDNMCDILCNHCKICSPCREATLSPSKNKLFKKIKLVHNQGDCECIEMAAPFITDSYDGMNVNSYALPETAAANAHNQNRDNTCNQPPQKVTILVNENSDCPTLFHQGAKSDTICRQNRKRPAECIDQDFKSVPTFRY